MDERNLTDLELKNLILINYISLTPSKLTILKKRILQNKLLHNEIKLRTIGCVDKINEQIYWILHDIYETPKCHTCNTTIITKHNFSFKKGYNKHCSPKCAGINPQVKQNIIDANMRIYGVPVSSQNEQVKNKRNISNLQIYGSISPFGNKQVQEKSNNTKLLRYGHINYVQSDIGKAKVKQLNMEKHGVEYTFQREDVKEKSRQTHLEKRGVENICQCPSVIIKRRETNMLRYNGPAPIYSKEVYNKMVNTNIETYGVPNAMQNEEIFKKQQKNSYYKKQYTLPSGKIVMLQGYENVAIDELLKTYNENDIELDNIPKIPFDNKWYFPDIFIPIKNLIIEVKSSYTYEKQLEKNLLKAKATIEFGYNYEIWICINKTILQIIKF